MRLWAKVVIYKDYIVAERDDRLLILKYNAVEVVRKESDTEGLYYVVKARYGNIEWSISTQAIEYKMDQSGVYE